MAKAVLDSLRTIFKPLRFGTDAHTIPGPLANHGDGTTQCAICLKHDTDPIWVSIDSQRAWECHAHILVRSTPRTDAAGYREPRRLWRCYEVTETYQTVTTIDREVTTIVRFCLTMVALNSSPSRRQSSDRPSSPRRTSGNLVSQRVQMYEAPLNVPRKGYVHRQQDSFHTPPKNPFQDSRDEIMRMEDDGIEGIRSSPARSPDDKVHGTVEVPLVPQTYAGCSLIESGVAYYQEGEYQKALKAFNTALKTQRVSVGDDDVCIALTLGNLGSVYLQQNNLDDAERVLQESLDIKRRLAPDMVVADTLNNLGNCANLRGELEASLIYYEEALEDIRTKRGRAADEINALFNIGRLEIQRQHWTKAMYALNDACKMAKAYYGTHHQFVAQTLDLIGFAQISNNKIDSSMVSFTSALAIYRRLFGPMHLEVANSLFNVGMVREAKGELSDAWEAYTTARDLYSRLGTDHDHPGYKTVRRSIANVEKIIASKPRRRNSRSSSKNQVSSSEGEV